MKLDKWTKEDTNAIKALGYILLTLFFLGSSNVNSTTEVTPTTQKIYVAVTPIPIPIPTPVPIVSNNYIFDIDREAGIILYKKGDCIITTMIYTRVNEESGICVGDDWNNFGKEIRKIKSIVETPIPIPVSISTPVPTSMPIASTDKPFENPWDFIEYVQKNWKYEYDTPGKVVQEPAVSFKLLSGDCDDFATMVAYYLQEVYGYDTVILRVQLPEGPHLVAFLATTEGVTQEIIDNCNVYLPMWERNGIKYIAIDWQICPGWTWTNPEGTKIYSKEWSDYVGGVY